MLTKTLMLFLLNIILLAGVQNIYATQSRVDSDQYNIARPMTLDTRNRKRTGKGASDIIRGILNKRREKMVPPVIEDKIKPPPYYYLDPPRFSNRDRSRLA